MKEIGKMVGITFNQNLIIKMNELIDSHNIDMKK